MSKFEVYAYEFLPDPPLDSNGVNRVIFQCTYNHPYPMPDLSRYAEERLENYQTMSSSGGQSYLVCFSAKAKTNGRLLNRMTDFYHKWYHPEDVSSQWYGTVVVFKIIVGWRGRMSYGHVDERDFERIRSII
ncbi:uncharacterized protein BT62DRAFT_994914 [Guyanagaster necrorhizus]|uniref:Uncharacterized protein n=1 Tax=Guyanagaster necrorhizus TaxID=856835 RepID=A0A9P8ARQ9_9AGAR|nr:uncharacterized protein BT62DRAFT_994914 [Guyanagaster necrorhizus MCA 3950]KAG7445459.1 hypothetical protein BT62DRAFT_994914 [Guyanagaster necrorhizus MCA 3950]